MRPMPMPVASAMTVTSRVAPRCCLKISPSTAAQTSAISNPGINISRERVAKPNGGEQQRDEARAQRDQHHHAVRGDGHLTDAEEHGMHAVASECSFRSFARGIAQAVHLLARAVARLPSERSCAHGLQSSQA